MTHETLTTDMHEIVSDYSKDSPVHCFTRMWKRLAVSGVLRGRRRTTSRFPRRFIYKSILDRRLARSHIFFKIVCITSLLHDSGISMIFRWLRHDPHCELFVIKYVLQNVSLKIRIRSLKMCSQNPRGVT